MQVVVRDNNVDQALKVLKKKMQREGIFREMKLRGHFEKPSEKKAREKAEAVRRDAQAGPQEAAARRPAADAQEDREAQAFWRRCRCRRRVLSKFKYLNFKGRGFDEIRGLSFTLSDHLPSGPMIGHSR